MQIYRRILIDNNIVDHSDVVGASPVGAAPTTSSFSTLHLAFMDWTRTTARRDYKHLSCGIWCAVIHVHCCPVTRCRRWPKQTWFECVKNDVREYGLSGVDPINTYAWGAGVSALPGAAKPIEWDTEITLISKWIWWSMMKINLPQSTTHVLKLYRHQRNDNISPNVFVPGFIC